jgi:diphthine synthase
LKNYCDFQNLEMLYIIGLGLSDLEDITVKGLKAIQSSDKVYLEHYTSILREDLNYKQELEVFYNKEIILADRTMVETNSDEIIEKARHETISFLVVGDPFGATTHTDLVLRAIQKNINYKIIHNASIMNAVGCCGLQLYSFGETVSICFWSDTENWRPKSYFDKICSNRVRGLHTLCLLDIKVKEKSVENLIKGRDIYEPARYMSVSQACEQLIEIANEKITSEEFKVDQSIINMDTLCVGLARVGKDDQIIAVDNLKSLVNQDLGRPLHSLIGKIIKFTFCIVFFVLISN